MHVVLTEHFAGVERHIGDLSAALRPHGWRIVVAAGARSEPVALRHYRAAGAELAMLPGGGGLATALGLRKTVRALGADVVHAHLGNAMLAATAGSAGRPLVVTQHFIRPRHQGSPVARITAPVYGGVLRRAQAVVAISEAVHAAVAPVVAGSGARLVTIPHGVPDVDQTVSQREPALLFVGRMSPEKRPLLAVRAAARAGGDWQLWMAGTGELDAQVREAGERLLGRRFRMLGFQEDVVGLYRRARALVVPSVAEPFGLVAVEAMRSSLPVIATESGALPEIVDATVGRLVDPDDEAGLVAAMLELIEDEALAARLGTAARQRYLSYFEAARMGARTAELYAGLLA